jgi:adenylate cyclase
LDIWIKLIERIKIMHKKENFYTSDDLKYIFTGAVSEEYLKKILTMDPPLDRESKIYTATAFFADIKDATSIGEKLGDEEFRKLISKVLEMITVETTKRDGYVDKFVGDEAMIIFGAPLPLSERKQALTTADLSFAILNNCKKIGVKISVGFGMGLMSFGNYGTNNRPSFTPMGNEINTAARMEGYARKYGIHPIITSNVYELIKNQYRVVFAGQEQTKIRDNPMEIYAIIEKNINITKEETLFWDRYDAALNSLTNGSVVEAFRQLTELRYERPDELLISNTFNRVSRIYAEKLGNDFSSIPDIRVLAIKIEESMKELFGVSEFGLLEPGVDGMWRFREEKPFSYRTILFSPGGDVLIWMKGLLQSTSVKDGPDPINSVRFSDMVPLRKDNELKAMFFVNPEEQINRDVFTAFASGLALSWDKLRIEEMKSNYQGIVDDTQKLEELNRELENKSVILEQSLSENQELNKDLEKRIQSTAARLERAASLKRYLPPSVVDEIIEGGRDLTPHTERRRITVMFSDVKGFTSATDGLEPEELSRLLNEYLSTMSDIAFKAGATIDKFRGDGMMVFFGAPKHLDPKEGANLCLKMALEMNEEVGHMKSKWFDEGYDWDLGIRIGINTGYATVGEFGSYQRMDYTAIGTEVNIAARLETACELDSILVSHSTWAMVKDNFKCVEKGVIELKGIHRKIRTYNVSLQE